MPVSTWRAWCLCGDWVQSSSTNNQIARGVIDMFRDVHAGDGHGPATRQQAAAARRRTEREEVRHAD